MDQLRMYRGDAREINIPLTLAGVEWDIPVDATVKMTAKWKLRDEDAEAVFVKSTGAGITSLANAITITIDPEDTAEVVSVSSQILECDVQVSSDTVGPWTVARFQLIIDPDVTQT